MPGSVRFAAGRTNLRTDEVPHLPMNLSSARCFRGPPRPSSSNSSLRQKNEDEDEDEVAWQVQGPDARPILEVEALHEPERAAGILPAEEARFCRRDVGSTLLRRTSRFTMVHGSEARPMLEFGAFHE